MIFESLFSYAYIVTPKKMKLCLYVPLDEYIQTPNQIGVWQISRYLRDCVRTERVCYQRGTPSSLKTDEKC